MADQCIVCLEDLDSVHSDPDRIKSEPQSDDDLSTPNTSNERQDSGQLVAKIKTCGHLLHDDCVKEWTLKANSCPICRTAFNLVEVYDKIGGE